MKIYNLYLIITLFFCISCEFEKSHGFHFVDAKKSNVNFVNEIPSSDIINILSFEYLYNGGGVGAADFDKDGYQDLFFTGNFVENALYLNRGNFEFQDITSKSNIGARNKWCTGVTIVDINNDTWPDIYVSVNSFNSAEEPDNLLFLHKGLDEDGIPQFEESAAKYGIQSKKHSMHAAFFDYDLDGDLDLYVLNNHLDLVSPSDYRVKQVDGQAPNSDQLFRNEGNGSFTDVSVESGIVIEGYGLGLAITDFNKDGYPDIYLANDYITNDILYVNQTDGTFKNEIGDRLKKHSKFSMGVSASDFNNDAKTDFFVLDMLPNTSYRLKTLNGNSAYNNHVYNKRYDYEEQNIRNTLQINKDGNEFVEMAYQSGVYASDWSWTPLSGDFDLDGDLDLYITNGFPKDVTDLDFINYKANRSIAFNRKQIIDEIPEVKISNIFFENEGEMKFSDKTSALGLNTPSFSNGAISVDLDNDGDLDIVTNNINQAAFLIENNSTSGNYLKVKFRDDIAFNTALLTKVYAYSNKGVQYREFNPHQSYLSSAPQELIFGLGASPSMDSVILIYPNSNKKVIKNVQANQTIEIEDCNGLSYTYAEIQEKNPVFRELKLPASETLYFDGTVQATIPNDYSHKAPQLENTDLGIIACLGRNEFPYVIEGNSFEPLSNFPQLKGVTDVVEIDIDNNGEKDLLFTNASYQRPSSKRNSLILLLQKKGLYTLNTNIFENIFGSHEVLRVNDVDGDGDDDLFLGSGYENGKYPNHSKHYLVLNNGDSQENPILNIKEVKYPFAIQDAKWVDINLDGKNDLVVAGHWQEVTVLINRENTLVKSETNIFNSGKGLWNRVLVTDLNEDGKSDLIAANYGTNTHFRKGPLEMFVKDFDNNGTPDPLVFYHYNGERQMTPLDLKDEFISQIPLQKKKFTDYESFANATLDNFFTESEIEGLNKFEVTELRSLAFLSSSDGYKKVVLPNDCQIAPMCVIAELERGIFLGGNISYGKEFWGKHNASNSVILEFKDGTLEVSEESTLKVKGDIKDILIKGSNIYIGRDENSIIQFPDET